MPIRVGALRYKWYQTERGLHVVACASNALKRVCRSTLTVETYQVVLGVEAADHLRAAVVAMFTTLSKRWEIEATGATQRGWMSDCDSTRSALVPLAKGKPADNRLGVTIASLRQAIWRRRAERGGSRGHLKMGGL